MKFYISIFCLAVLTFWSCGDSMEDILNDDIAEIQEYLSAKGLTAESTASGLHYIIELPGSDEKPTVLDIVKVRYTGYLTDDTVFNSSGNDGISFPLNAVIQGWQEGIPLYGRGGKGKLLIPSHLAYADNPPPGIPVNAVLIFDVELLDF